MAGHNGDHAAAPKGVILIVLFGNKNEPDGCLKPIALERCDRAAQLAKEFPESLILPTGSFGKDFNTSSKPHGELLRDHLVKIHGISALRVLPFTNSSWTLEDVLFVRKVAVDLKAKRIVFVTSSFHMDRVQYICGRIFPDYQCSYEPADEKRAHREQEPDEKKKLDQLKAQWVDVPLYSDPPRGTRFPLPVYVNASREQKHYDFLSYLFISAIFLAFAFPYTLDPGKLHFCSIWPLFLLSALAILLLYVMYLRAAYTARTARTIMRNIEAQYGQPGFSFNYPRQGSRVFTRYLSFPILLGTLAGAMAVIQLLVAFESRGSAGSLADYWSRILNVCRNLRGLR